MRGGILLINLLSPNDLEQLRRAMASGQEIFLTRTLGALTVTVSTTRALPVWKCDMLVRLERTHGHVYSSQYFCSVEEMMQYECGLVLHPPTGRPASQRVPGIASTAGAIRD